MKKITLLFLVVSMFTMMSYADEEFFDEFEDEFSNTQVQKIFDPLSSYNEVMTGFNDFIYTGLVFPVSRGYKKVVNRNIRVGVSNFFDNLSFPINFVNNIFQLKIKNALEELARFSINSTFGLFGFFDPAKRNLSLESHKEDFGQSLGYWGIGGGFPIVLPILGQSNLRDSVGLVVDKYIDPMNYWDDRSYNVFDDTISSVSTTAFNILNKSSFEEQNYKNLRKDALELYPFFREIYEQNRDKKISE